MTCDFTLQIQHKVESRLFYFKFEEGSETVPDRHDQRTWTCSKPSAVDLPPDLKSECGSERDDDEGCGAAMSQLGTATGYDRKVMPHSSPPHHAVMKATTPGGGGSGEGRGGGKGRGTKGGAGAGGGRSSKSLLSPNTARMGEGYEESDSSLSQAQSRDDTFSVFWQNRLVPESTAKKLFFFPTWSKHQLAEKGISDRWQERVRGLLFFDWNFQFISNNKLKLQLDPNMDEWLNDAHRARHITYEPRFIERELEKWLQDCHRQDREFTFADRNRVYEEKMRKLRPGHRVSRAAVATSSTLSSSSSRPFSFEGSGDVVDFHAAFKTMSIDGTNFRLAAGDTVKLHLTSAGRVSNDKDVAPKYAKITAFVVKGSIDCDVSLSL